MAENVFEFFKSLNLFDYIDFINGRLWVYKYYPNYLKECHYCMLVRINSDGGYTFKLLVIKNDTKELHESIFEIPIIDELDEDNVISIINKRFIRDIRKKKIDKIIKKNNHVSNR